MTEKTIRVTTDTVQQAIERFIDDRGENRFTTADIARFMGVEEYPVRAAIGWLHNHRVIEDIPGVKSRRYTRTTGEEYSASVFRLLNYGQCDINSLMLAFCR